MVIARIFFETAGILIGYAIGGSAIAGAVCAERWIWKLVIGAIGVSFLIRAWSEFLFHAMWPTKVIVGILVIPSTVGLVLLGLGFLAMKMRRKRPQSTEGSDLP